MPSRYFLRFRKSVDFASKKINDEYLADELLDLTRCRTFEKELNAVNIAIFLRKRRSRSRPLPSWMTRRFEAGVRRGGAGRGGDREALIAAASHFRGVEFSKAIRNSGIARATEESKRPGEFAGNFGGQREFM